jgi:diguanylate cyclase (GGDEF)-like protein
VHNLKVYLLGYLIGLFGIAYFGLYKFLSGSVPHGYVPALYCLMFVNCIGVMAVPSVVKFRKVRQITLATVTAEAILLVVARVSPQATEWASALTFDTIWDFRILVALAVFGIALAVSLWRVKQDFYLGGILAGWVLFFVPAWMSRYHYHALNPVETMIFTIMPLYCTLGVLIHWFLRMDHRIAYDPLLHIYNRDYCSKIISEQSNLNVTPPFSVAMVDIDHFKKVNDTYGHQAGDQVLYAVAQAITKEVVPHGTVCRYGGEEISVFFPQKTLREAEQLSEKVRAAIEAMKTKTRKKSLSVTVSIGVSCKEDPAASIIDVIHAADKALYKAKEGGRNQVRSGKMVVEAPQKKK